MTYDYLQIKDLAQNLDVADHTVINRELIRMRLINGRLEKVQTFLEANRPEQIMIILTS